jgi:hypothetical protein
VHEFVNPADGKNAVADLLLDSAGNLYGATSDGGDLNCPSSNGKGCGVVFKLVP